MSVLLSTRFESFPPTWLGPHTDICPGPSQVWGLVGHFNNLMSPPTPKDKHVWPSQLKKKPTKFILNAVRFQETDTQI